MTRFTSSLRLCDMFLASMATVALCLHSQHTSQQCRFDQTCLHQERGNIVAEAEKWSGFVQASAFTWFVVQTRSGDLTPFSIRHTVKPLTVMPSEETQQQLLDLASAVTDDYGRMDLSSLWRPYHR